MALRPVLLNKQTNTISSNKQSHNIRLAQTLLLYIQKQVTKLLMPTLQMSEVEGRAQLSQPNPRVPVKCHLVPGTPRAIC